MTTTVIPKKESTPSNPADLYTLSTPKMLTQEKMASPLEHNPNYLHYWSKGPQDKEGLWRHSQCPISKFTGFSMCHPIFDDQVIHNALKHAIYSVITSTNATATFMFLPCWNGIMNLQPYSKLLTTYQHLCYTLGYIPASNLTYATPPSGSAKKHHPPAKWSIQIIAVWNTAARPHLNDHNSTWIKDLANDMPEAT